MFASKKPLSRRTFLQLTSLAATGATLAACAPAIAPSTSSSTGSSAGESAAPSTETYVIHHWSWLAASDAAVWGQLIDNFNTEHADQGVQIEKLDLPSNEYKTKVVAAAATGQAPDFGWGDTGERADLINDGVMVELGQHLENAGLDWSDFTELGLAATGYPQWEGKYHMPLDAMTWQMLVNLDHVAEAGLDPASPPTTAEELIEWSKAMTKTEGDTVVRSGFLMTGAGLHIAFIWGLVAHQMGFRQVSEDMTQAGINPDAAKEAAQWVLDLFDTHKVATRDVADRYKAFGTAEGSLFITGPWTLNGYVEQKLNFGVVYTPNIGGEHATRLSIGGQEMYVQEDEARYARSAEALKWLSDNSFLWTTVGRGAACRQSILDREDYQSAGHSWDLRGPFVEGMSFATFVPPKLKATPDFKYYTSPNLVHRVMDPVWQGEKGVSEGVDELVLAWNDLLAQE